MVTLSCPGCQTALLSHATEPTWIRCQHCGHHFAFQPLDLPSQLPEGLKKLQQKLPPLPAAETLRPATRYRIACALLSVLLGLQYLHFEADSLSQSKWREWLKPLCKIAFCEIPPPDHFALIDATALQVRSHPDIDGALVIDTLLLNAAPRQQPFPDIEILFSDLSGQAIAYRRFSAADYQYGELALAAEMPANQPLHLSLEIRDPGPTAVNYRMKLLRSPTE